MAFRRSSIKGAFLLVLGLGILSNANAQCVLTANDDTEAEVAACLTACGCIEVQVPDGVTISMAEAWDLTSFGAIQITIQGSGSIAFSGSGANRDEIILAAGSQVIIEDITNTNALTKESGGNGNIRVTIGGETYDANDFQDIIDNGGVDENWPGPPGTPLPVDLIYFEGRRNLQGVLLSWRTATELDNDYFEIELSADGENFSPIAKISGAGNSSQPIDYQWLHGSPSLGLNYYRLKQVDYNGDFEYFRTVLVNNETAVPLYCSVYPNPARQKITFKVFSSDNNNFITLFILNANGMVIRSIPVNAKEKLFELNAEGLNGGLYFYKVVQANNTFSGKLLLQD